MSYLLKGPRAAFSVENLSPVEALGIHAREDAERQRYAEMFALALQADVERSLAWNRAFQQAQSRLYPNQKVVDFEGLPMVEGPTSAADLLGIPRKGGNEEAILLFTSGSSGTPKGVGLTHRNVMTNVIQFSSRLGLKHSDSILGSLPLFHSFGCTVTLWYPIICGVDLVTYPSPLEVKKLAELIEKHRISLIISTPTFLRGYLRGVNKEALTSIKLCVTGAEKLPVTVADLNFSSQNRWAAGASPSSADASSGTAYQGCGITNASQYSFIYKRTNFTCGYYRIDLPQHDDFVTLIVKRINCVYSRLL